MQCYGAPCLCRYTRKCGLFKLKMWIKYGLIFGLVNTFQFIGVFGNTQTICAYRNDTFALNATRQLQLFDDKRQGIFGNGRQGQFVKNDEEYCSEPNGASQCYTLWEEPKTQHGQPVVIKQGCYMSSSCQESRCDYSKATAAGHNSPLKFCCCTGNKCNDVDKGHRKQQYTQPTKPKTVSNTKGKQGSKGAGGKNVLCAFKLPSYVSGKKMSHNENEGMGEVMADRKSARCNASTDYCFSFYQTDPKNTSAILVKYQGCWNDLDRAMSCSSNVCLPNNASYYSHKMGNNSHFCCCVGNMCNNNISQEIIIRNSSYIRNPSGPVYLHMHDPSYKQRTILISLLSVLSLAIMVLVVFLAYRFCLRPAHVSSSINSSVDIPQSPAFDIDDLKISCLISKGRYSEVWRGSLSEQDVAVKIYSPVYRQYYVNEKYIYSLPHMNQENILKFLGGEERILQDGNPQHLLVLQYIPDGTLMNYLKNNTIDWHTMCGMCLTLARGMSHLHSDIGEGEAFKPTVAHRDMNSRNVLVKADLSLVIADLGFCMTTMGSKLIHKGYTENAEQTSLTDVGTLRYMAPELLDGAVNLRDCEASLKQIDMYAFGLVMWEIASRCSELYQGCPMPEFALPYNAEAGNHPTFEEMQLLVSRNKVRPKFPEVWKEYNQAIRTLKETIEECWDHDAEARLTALCVEERIMEMKALWSHDNRNKSNKGVTPTINTALLSHNTSGTRPAYHGNGHTQWAGLSSESSAPNVVSEGNTSALIINDIRNSRMMSHSESSSTLPPTWTGDRRGSFSTSTMETTVGITPVDNVPSPPSHPKSQNINAMMNQHVPPHQGRNPIVERNTHKRSDEELAVVGNNLLYGKEQNDGDRMANTDSIFDSFSDSLESSLMQHDTLNHALSPPATYMHNQGNLNTERPRKVINNPNECRDNIANAGNLMNSSNINTGSSQKANKKVKEMGLLGHLALIGKLAFGGKFESKRNDADQYPASRIENGRVQQDGRQNSTMFQPSQTYETEIRLTNAGPVVRPANFQQKPCNTRKRETSLSNLDRDLQRNSVDVDSVDSSETDLQHSESPLISRNRMAPYSKSTSDLSPQETGAYCVSEELEDESKLPRPSTLSLKGHNYHKIGSASLNSLTKYKGKVGSQKLGKGNASKKQLQNGYTIIAPADNNCNSVGKTHVVKPHASACADKAAHFSLIDDRLMSKGDMHSSTDNSSAEWNSSGSLGQFDSIDENPPRPMANCTC